MMSYLNRRRLLTIGGATLMVAGIQAPALALGADSLVSLKGHAFGSTWAVTLHAGTNLVGLRQALEDMLAEVDRMMSPWRPDSEITTFNSSPAGTLAVSPETALVAQAAMKTARLSEGWFDPTVGPLVAKWGFGPIEGNDSGTIHLGGISAAPSELVKAENRITLDLCGIAKGYALDNMARIIENFGYRDFLVDLGGELKAKGLHPEGRCWQVAIEDPRPGFDTPAEGLKLEGRAVATSGRRAQSYQIGRMIYSHIIDPSTGIPVQSTTLSVSVLAHEGINADAWATALVAAGNEGPVLAERFGIAALFLMQQADGLGRKTTGDFNRYLL